ncbi:aspartate ammonia-lyase [Brevibacillus humidisoli]|uniref:class II fumarate hydratase n=1 Tax=Brevibacillus humidisoli TaxID=2895522 RepID=UPI001E331B7C|nr:aspartate ammonia-lyase [Brevibacillus humidisoli]UFJ42644.1 aspartate ammonia-lyase [Brevibacillus humidisoli]
MKMRTNQEDQAVEMRISRDTLGEVQIPQDVYYDAQTQRAVENFPISGLRLPRAFIRAQGIIKASAAAANMAVGSLPREIGEVIQQVAEEVAEGKWDDQFVVDVFQAGAGTSQNMNANEVIANLANERLGGKKGEFIRVHPNDHVNMAQSTNDTIHVAINISAYTELTERLLPTLRELVDSLRQKQQEFQPIFKSGRTHLQDAVPIRLGQEFGGYAQTLANCEQSLHRSSKALLEIGIGGNAVGTGINAHPDYPQRAVQEIARRTGHPFRQPVDRFAFMQNTSAAIQSSHALKELAIHLIKITSDLRLLSSGPRTGLAELQLPAVQPGSSIMPGKVNPVMLEMVYMVASQVIGNDATITAAGMGSQLEINVMMPVIAFNMLFSIDILTQALRVLRERCIEGIAADEQRCSSYVEQSLALATSLNPLIGYEKAAEIAKQAYREGKTIREIAGRETGLSLEQLAEHLDPQRHV